MSSNDKDKLIEKLQRKIAALVKERDQYKDWYHDLKASAEIVQDMTAGVDKVQQRIKDKNLYIESLERRLAAESPLEIIRNEGVPDSTSHIMSLNLPGSQQDKPNSVSVHAFAPDEDKPIAFCAVGDFHGTREQFRNSIYFSLRVMGLFPTLDDIPKLRNPEKYGLTREHFRDEAVPFLIHHCFNEDDEAYQDELNSLIDAAWKTHAPKELHSETSDTYSNFRDYYSKACERSCKNIIGRLSVSPDYEGLQKLSQIDTTTFVVQIPDETT